MRALFVSAQLGSHLDWGGYLRTAAALAARGHEVLWVSGKAVASQIAAQGIHLHVVKETGWRWPPPPPLTPDDLTILTPAEQQQRRQSRSLDQWLEPERVHQALQELNLIITEFQPDLVVGEMFMAAAALAAEQARIPFIVAGWPAPVDAPSRNGATPAADPVLAQARTRLSQLLQMAGVTGHNWTRHGPPALCSPHLHLSYWSPSWFGKSEQHPAYGKQTVHVGGQAQPAAPPDPELPSPEDRPWILVTLGTTFNQDAPFFQMACQAVIELGCLPIVALGAPLDAPWARAWVENAPPPTHIRPWLNFDAVLPYIAAAIHHGGAGTTHALVTHAVPQIVVPHAADQMRQAHGVARTEIGVGLLPKNVSAPVLVQVLGQLLPDRVPARAKAKQLQTEFAGLGGVEAAAAQLEQLHAALPLP